jgi:hypothetical protein
VPPTTLSEWSLLERERPGGQEQGPSAMGLILPQIRGARPWAMRLVTVFLSLDSVFSAQGEPSEKGMQAVQPSRGKADGVG